MIKLVYGTNDCSKCTPDKSSKTCACTKFIPNYIYYDEECLYCKGYFFSQKKYYKIEKSGQISICQVITNKGMIQNFKFVHGTHFFRSECPSGMRPLGSVCNSSLPPNAEEKNGKYACKKYFYKETRENLFDIIHSLPDVCEDGKYSLSSILCSKSCPKNVKEDEWVTECDDKLIIIDSSANIRICSGLSLSSPCPNIYPYKYNNKHCLKSCQETLSTLLDKNENLKTYLLDDREKNICIMPSGITLMDHP